MPSPTAASLGKVLQAVSTFLGDPIVLELTATPPDPMDVDEEDFDRYTSFLGEGGLRPSACVGSRREPSHPIGLHFVRPTASEYIAGVRGVPRDALSELATSRP